MDDAGMLWVLDPAAPSMGPVIPGGPKLVRIDLLETDSLGGNPVLRRSKDDEGIRPLSANRNTIKAMEQRGLISPGKGRARSLLCGV